MRLREFSACLHTWWGDLEKSGFSNIEQQSLEFVKYTLEPWIICWDQSLNRALLTEKELTIYFYDDDADQKALIDAAKTQQTVRIRHQWPNGTIASYDLKLLGYQIMSGSADGFMQLKVSGRQASDVVWADAENEEQTGKGGK